MSHLSGESFLAGTTPTANSFPRPPLSTRGSGQSPRIPPPTDDSAPRPSAIPSGSPRPPQPSSPRTVTSNPVCYFHYGDRHVKARIDREVPLDEIVRQLAASSQLAVAEPAALFALREKTSGVLVTEENLTRMLEKGNVFDLCSSPTIEAVEMVEKLHSSAPSVVKLATFSLRTLIQERAFLGEFIARGGLEALQDVIRRSSGNTLAYSLLSLQNLLELDEDGGSTGLERSFVARIVEIIATEPLINISRPATAILRRLASQPPSGSAPYNADSPNPSTPRSGANDGTASGFAAVYDEISQQPRFLTVVVERLSSGDVPVTNSSLSLLNTLLRGATGLGDFRLSEELDALDAWKTVGKLLAGTTGADLPTLLSLQSALVSSLNALILTRVDTPHYNHFDEIWLASGLEDVDELNRWRRLGFRTESPQFEFDAVGVLGLKQLARYATEGQNEFAQTIADQLARPETRRCPISTVSNTVLYILSQHFSLLLPPSAAPTLVPNPYLFRLPELHSLVVSFFLRMWNDSSATSVDYDRVTKLTESQVAYVLGGGGEKTWFKVRQEFNVADYRSVRERWNRELEMEDDIGSKASVRNLRGRLYLESYEFVRAQRIACLHEGAWFAVTSAPSVSGSGGTTPQGRKAAPSRGGAQATRWRFYRLAANRMVLHWVEASEKKEIRSGLDDLPERLDLALVTDIVPSGALALSSQPRANGHRTTSSTSNGPAGRLSFLSKQPSETAVPPPAPVNPSSASQPLSFTLHSSSGPLVSLLAPTPALYSEWVDGLSLLRPAFSSGGSISTRTTADYVNDLTDIGVKIKLLDLSGERVEIPNGAVAVGAVPRSTEFFYSDTL